MSVSSLRRTFHSPTNACRVVCKQAASSIQTMWDKGNLLATKAIILAFSAVP